MNLHMGNFPEASSRENRYKPVDNIRWTGVLWTAMLWTAYEYTGNKNTGISLKYNMKALLNVLIKRIYTDTHDLGFLWLPSCVADMCLQEMKQ